MKQRTKRPKIPSERIWHELHTYTRNQLDIRTYALIRLTVYLAKGCTHSELTLPVKLLSQYYSDTQIIDLMTSERSDLLSEKEQVMLQFVRKSVLQAEAIKQADIKYMKRNGFGQKAVFDILAAIPMAGYE